MTLFLDHVQRLNLNVLLGLLECNVAETRAVWKIMDQLSLTDEEKKAIGHFTQSFNGDEVQGWDQTKSLPPKSYDFADADTARIRRAIQQFPRHRVAFARPWLEPLLEQLPVEEEDPRRASFARG
jgi:hypothetical protein